MEVLEFSSRDLKIIQNFNEADIQSLKEIGTLIDPWSCQIGQGIKDPYCPHRHAEKLATERVLSLLCFYDDGRRCYAPDIIKTVRYILNNLENRCNRKA